MRGADETAQEPSPKQKKEALSLFFVYLMKVSAITWQAM
jgi:hypothetical protein